MIWLKRFLFIFLIWICATQKFNKQSSRRWNENSTGDTRADLSIDHKLQQLVDQHITLQKNSFGLFQSGPAWGCFSSVRSEICEVSWDPWPFRVFFLQSRAHGSCYTTCTELAGTQVSWAIAQAPYAPRAAGASCTGHHTSGSSSRCFGLRARVLEKRPSLAGPRLLKEWNSRESERQALLCRVMNERAQSVSTTHAGICFLTLQLHQQGRLKEQSGLPWCCLEALHHLPCRAGDWCWSCSWLLLLHLGFYFCFETHLWGPWSIQSSIPVVGSFQTIKAIVFSLLLSFSCSVCVWTCGYTHMYVHVWTLTGCPIVLCLVNVCLLCSTIYTRDVWAKNGTNKKTKYKTKKQNTKQKKKHKKNKQRFKHTHTHREWE